MGQRGLTQAGAFHRPDRKFLCFPADNIRVSRTGDSSAISVILPAKKPENRRRRSG